RARRRPASPSDDARALGHLDDADLHARLQVEAPARLRRLPPPREAPETWENEAMTPLRREWPRTIMRSRRSMSLLPRCLVLAAAALALGPGALRAELVVFEDGRVVKVASYRVH